MYLRNTYTFTHSPRNIWDFLQLTEHLDNHQSLPELAIRKGLALSITGGQMELSGNFEREWKSDYKGRKK